jgi:hypothetical protein
MISRRVRVVARPCGVRALNARTRVREQVRVGARETRAWVPSSEADPAPGGARPSSERASLEWRGGALERGGPRLRGRKGLERGGPRPRERLSLERGGAHSRGVRCVVLVGRGGYQGRGCAVYVLLGVRVDMCFVFFAGFKRVSPWLFRGPLWLPPTISIMPLACVRPPDCRALFL